MVCYCAIKRCLSTSKNQDRRFFRFPTDEKRCKQWIQSTGRPELRHKTLQSLRKNYFICDLHFQATDRFVKKLKSIAVPSLNLPQQENVIDVNPTKSTQRVSEKSLTDEVVASHTFSIPIKSNATTQTTQNFSKLYVLYKYSNSTASYSGVTREITLTPSSGVGPEINQGKSITERQEEYQRLHLEQTQERERQLRAERQDHLEHTQQLKRKLPREDLQNYYRYKLMNEEPKLKPTALLCSMKPDTSTNSTELRKLLVQQPTTHKPIKRKYEDTLNIPNTSAYSTLPMKVTTEGLSCEQDSEDISFSKIKKLSLGDQEEILEVRFTDESFELLRARYSRRGKKLACLVVSEIPITELKNCNGINFALNDYGNVTQAYVLMIVSLNDSFETPVGYFLDNELTAEQKGVIVKKCLQRCHDVGAEVVSVTFNGCAADFAVAKTLGCDLGPSWLSTYFDHPSTKHPVFVFMDHLNMTKLTRNLWESKRIITTNGGKIIDWQYIEELKKIQNDLSLYFEHNLKNKNLDLINNAISSSVAEALTLCSEDLQLPQFEGVSETVRFIRIISGLCDALNANCVIEQGKQQTSACERRVTTKMLDDLLAYLPTLKIKVSTITTREVGEARIKLNNTVEKAVIDTNAKTGLIGLMTCARSYKLLIHDEVVKKYCKVVTPYKFSMDHIEMFFGAMRTYEPNNASRYTHPFDEIYTKALHKTVARSKLTKKKVDDFHVCNSPVKQLNNTTSGIRYHKDDSGGEETKRSIAEEKYDVMADILDTSIQPVDSGQKMIGYMAGCVVKNLCNRIKCKYCKKSLLGHEKKYYHKLISRRELGAYPSDVVYKVCHRSEAILRRMKSVDKLKYLGKVKRNKLAVLRSKCFQEIASFKDTFKGLEKYHVKWKHNILLIKSIIEEFIKIRLGSAYDSVLPTKTRKYLMFCEIHESMTLEKPKVIL